MDVDFVGDYDAKEKKSSYVDGERAKREEQSALRGFEDKGRKDSSGSSATVGSCIPYKPVTDSLKTLHAGKLSKARRTLAKDKINQKEKQTQLTANHQSGDGVFNLGASTSKESSVIKKSLKKGSSRKSLRRGNSRSHLQRDAKSRALIQMKDFLLYFRRSNPIFKKQKPKRKTSKTKLGRKIRKDIKTKTIVSTSLISKNKQKKLPKYKPARKYGGYKQRNSIEIMDSDSMSYGSCHCGRCY